MGFALRVTTGLRLHVLGTDNTYVPLTLDIYSAASKQIVASGAGVDEARGATAPLLDLKPGTYKLVRTGAPFAARADYAVAIVSADAITDFVIVVDRDSLAFRGSGPLIGELPHGARSAACGCRSAAAAT